MPEAYAAALGRAFFARDARIVARALIGTFLVVSHDGEERVARIVETEAYRGPTDLACHARAGLTKRTKALFAVPGHAYVFFIYGMHECFNVTCLREGAGHAVLVRGVEPMLGMDGLRGDGPGRLTKAMGISRLHNGLDVTNEGSGIVSICPRESRPKIAVSARVGVAYAGEIADAPWRFFDATSRSVSRPPASAIGLGTTTRTKR
jgi:DNA-3-methyladenine glycosylase